MYPSVVARLERQRNPGRRARRIPQVLLGDSLVSEVPGDEDQVRAKTMRDPFGAVRDDLFENPLLGGAILAEVEIRAVKPAQLRGSHDSWSAFGADRGSASIMSACSRTESAAINVMSVAILDWNPK